MKGIGTGSWWVVGLMVAFGLAGLSRPTPARATTIDQCARFANYKSQMTTLLVTANPPLPPFQLGLLLNQLQATQNDVCANTGNSASITVFEDILTFVRLWTNYGLAVTHPALSLQVWPLQSKIIETLATDPAFGESQDDNMEMYCVQQWALPNSFFDQFGEGPFFG